MSIMSKPPHLHLTVNAAGGRCLSPPSHLPNALSHSRTEAMVMYMQPMVLYMMERDYNDRATHPGLTRVVCCKCDLSCLHFQAGELCRRIRPPPPGLFWWARCHLSFYIAKLDKEIHSGHMVEPNRSRSISRKVEYGTNNYFLLFPYKKKKKVRKALGR